jgi:hypothetical protein
MFIIDDYVKICQYVYSNSHKDFPKSGEALGQTRASAAHNSEIVYESRYNKDIFAPAVGVGQKSPTSADSFCARHMSTCGVSRMWTSGLHKREKSGEKSSGYPLKMTKRTHREEKIMRNTLKNHQLSHHRIVIIHMKRMLMRRSRMRQLYGESP